MADNRGNSSKTNSSLPNSRPNGVTRPSDKNSYDTYKSIDTKTIKEMQTVYSGLTKFALELGVNLKDFNNAIEKSADTIVSTRQKLDKTAKEYDAEVAEMKKHYFGANKKIAENYEKFIDEKKKLLEEEFEETRKEERKNIIKRSFISEKEKNSVKLLDSEYIKHNFRDVINNEYQSELEKLNTSALEMFGENFKTNSQYQKALMKLGEEYTKKALKELFKDESKQKEIKFMDNKFSKGNNLANVSNEYYSQLEKLKSDALDTFEDGLNNKEYKKALMNLNDEYAKNMKDAWKEDFKENHKVLGGIASGIKDTFERNKESLQGLLGPLNLFIAPLKEFFGGFGAVFKFIGGGVKTIFRKFTKKNPTASDVLKSGAYGVGSLYLGHKLDELFGKTKGDNNFDGLFDNFKDLGGTLSALNKAVTSFSTLATVAGLSMVIKDAISGWNKGEEWGTENWASMLGAIVGGTGSGASGAVHGAIKYALLGAPFGIAGILVGGIMGGILGFFGGKFWSQGLQDVKDLLTGKTNMTEMRKRELLKDVDKNKNLNEMQKSVMYKLADTLSEEDFVNLGNNLSNKNWGGALRGTIDNWLKGNFDTLSEDELVSLLQYQTGFSDLNKSNVNQYKEFFKQLHGSFSDVGLSNIYKNNQTLAWNMKELSRLQTVYDDYKKGNTTIDELNSVLNNSGFYGGVNSQQFKNLITSGLLNLSYANIGGLDTSGIKKKNQTNEFLSDLNYSVTDVNDAIIRTDGSVIKTNPKDTLVALKDIPLSMEQVRNDTTKNLNTSLSNLGNDKTLEKKLTTIIDVLSKILAKDIQVNLPPQTRSDLDIIMSGGMI